MFFGNGLLDGACSRAFPSWIYRSVSRLLVFRDSENEADWTVCATSFFEAPGGAGVYSHLYPELKSILI